VEADQTRNSEAAPGALALRRTVIAVALLNIGYFGIEFAVGLAIGSVSLFADSVDFLEDASINLLIAIGLGWSPRRRARLGMLLATILLVPACAGLWTAWQKLTSLAPPAAVPLTLTGGGALVINVTCALLLARFRDQSGSLTRAAFLSARNDAFANVAIIAAGIVTAFLWRSAWPDLIVGFGIAIMNADAARDVWTAAREESRAARA
jgi:Co/Zn/Cd efflux system component